MKRIFKYAIPIQDYIEKMMPRGARILHFATQNGIPFLWVMIEDCLKEDLQPYRFRIFGTGHKIENDKDLKYIGTVLVLDDGLVWHLFQEIN